MGEKREVLEKYIREKLCEFIVLGKNYNDDKIKKLVDNLCNTDKTIDELKKIVDSKFSFQLRKLGHNNHLSSLKGYYLSSVEKLKKGNNCYLLSYDEGVKVLEQAKVVDTKTKNKGMDIVKINDEMLAYKKDNVNSDYELIVSDIAFLLGIDYGKSYRMFDSKMNSLGILSSCFDSSTKVLNMEEVLSFVKEESSKFTLKEWLVEFHDCHKKKNTNNSLKDNFEYVFKLFEALPDMTKNNLEIIKKEYLNIIMFNVLVNNMDCSLNNISIVVNKKKVKYTYKLSSCFDFAYKSLDDNNLVFNFMSVDKGELIDYIVSEYYSYTKEYCDLINRHKRTLVPLIEQIIEEHLDFDEAICYENLVNSNLKLIATVFEMYKTMDSDDEELFKNNSEMYENRIAPFIDNYEIMNDEKGSSTFFNVMTLILIGTIILIGIAIFLISKANF